MCTCTDRNSVTPIIIITIIIIIKKYVNQDSPLVFFNTFIDFYKKSNNELSYFTHA